MNKNTKLALKELLPVYIGTKETKRCVMCKAPISNLDKDCPVCKAIALLYTAK